MAAVHCSILDCMCETIAGIGVEIHDLAHPLRTLRVDCTPCTDLYLKWMHCPCATSTLGISQFKSKFVVFAPFFIVVFRHVLFPWACELNPDVRVRVSSLVFRVRVRVRVRVSSLVFIERNVGGRKLNNLVT